MTTTHLLISLGTTICLGLFLYFYLKKRTERIEKKVNLMFQLIQEHEKQARQQAQIMISQKKDVSPPIVQTDINDLISVSEDEEYDTDSDDSAEVSDTEDNKLTISQTNVLGETITHLTLNGAETTQIPFHTLKTPVSSVQSLGENETDEDESDDEDGGDEDDDDLVKVEKKDEVGSLHNVSKVIELGGTANDLDEITLEDLDTKVVSPLTHPLVYDEIKAEVDHMVHNLGLKSNNVKQDMKQIMPQEEADLNKLKVTDLKAKCQSMGLNGYRSLRKSALIELIQSNSK
jgi:hypothetical protein